jgi:hypothetical protein
MAPLWNKLVRGRHDFTEVEAAQLSSVVRTVLMTGEVTYLQHQQGLISDRAFESMRKAWVAVLAFPAYRVLWRRFRGGFDPAFGAWIDEQIAQASFTLAGPAEDLNREIAEELAATAHAP